jgi:hypothetical protein
MTLSEYMEIALEAGIQIEDRDAWLRLFSVDSEIWPIKRDGVNIGGVLFYRNTVHIAVKPEWKCRWATRSMLRAYPTWTPSCDVFAPIKKDNTDSIRLAKHLGFELSHSTATHDIYIKRKHDEHPA